MEEKERYEQLYDGFIYDNKLKEYVSSPCATMKHQMKQLTDLLNYQDREINRLTKMLYTTTKHADKLNEENNKLNKEFKKCKQSQKQLAISELEKSKEKILSYEEIYYQFLESGAKVPVVCLESFRVKQTIDSQIEELKKGVD